MNAYIWTLIPHIWGIRVLVSVGGFLTIVMSLPSRKIVVELGYDKNNPNIKAVKS